MENLRYDLEEPIKRKSKYLNRIFDGWIVFRATRTEDGHTRFFLRKEFRDAKRHFDMTFTARDNELTKLARGKDINELIANKAVQCHQKKRNVFQNTIMSQFLN